ncbi:MULTISPECIES: hypothetical protein [Desulfovibrio]|jgi:hypothetical protein|uniref:hypothetical protein n=1 Tax=Desulfovibrio TaxID=872 RepID=UPI00041320C3|nr:MULTISPECIES: hypothetical protein [Desulfovibrio]MDY0307110.1 hypothetical protein [Desulfovibrionaceae bacterium]HMM39358.1 hypothetical protein [Desulfovibrio sp.]
MNDRPDCAAEQESQSSEHRVYVPFPGADEKYEDKSDWRLYNPAKYHDPDWSPDKE